METVRPPDVQQSIDQELATVRCHLGDAAYAQEWDHGYRLTEPAASDLVRSFLVSGPIIVGVDKIKSADH